MSAVRAGRGSANPLKRITKQLRKGCFAPQCGDGAAPISSSNFQYIVSADLFNHKSQKNNPVLCLKKIKKTLTNQMVLIYNGFLQVMACSDKLCLVINLKSVGQLIASLLTTSCNMSRFKYKF